ncbi:uncharacterized protein LOC105205847 [Solenopsis invicta]|uniref:uncharacterized protein LOC105205847 n=1 Tax=Solenopsis invicta TaxID=13686 RepID=UPI0001FEF061|nr:uncharacterized protein LOC105205847 [Solenopsis invicta]
MRIAIALYLSAVLCTIYANPTDKLESAKLQVQNAISNVERIIQKIRHVYINTKEDTINSVTDRLWEQMDNYRDYVNLLLKSMQREVDNAKRRGVDAQRCYDSNSWGVKEHSEEAHKASKKCKETAEKNIESSLEYLHSFTLLGDELIQQLNNILVDCHDKDDFKMHTCVLSELGKANNSVKDFEDDTKYIEYSALPLSNYVVLQASQCMTNAYLLARFECQGSQDSNSRCVREALEKI